MPRRVARPVPRPDDRLVRSRTWAGVRAGEPVEVAGTRMRGAKWTFLAHVHNRDTGDEWVEVVGGRGGDRAVRSFRPEQVLAPIGRPVPSLGRGRGQRVSRGQRPSLAEAPQLPLAPPAR